ncbi:MAG: 5'-3' exonuclease [Actinomycetota bacterium]|nr:5'-3' exonuclease [Actinomycetota bacterium]
MLLDTPSLYFRAYFGVPESVTAPDGTPVNAVRGLLDFVARLVTDRRPTRLVACDDADWRPAFRVAALPSYKAHRVLDPADPAVEQVPDTLSPQVPVLWDVLDAVGLACVGVEGYEADDVIGTLATTADVPVDVVTGDRDLFQLVEDGRVRVLYTARGVGNHEIVNEAWVCERYGIPGRAYADFALLRGDPSDGLPGVPGIGEKSAAALISRFGSLEGLLAALDAGDPAIPRAQRTRLEAARDYLAAAPPVVRVVRDLPVPAYDDRLPSEVRDPARLVELVDRWGLHSPMNRLLAALRIGVDVR